MHSEVYNLRCCDMRLHFIILLLLIANKHENYSGHFLKKQLMGFLCLYKTLTQFERRKSRTEGMEPCMDLVAILTSIVCKKRRLCISSSLEIM